MRLKDALAIRRGDVVAVVGAGGKTTLLAALARQARADGLTVITTTTTHMGAPREGAAVIEDGVDRAADVASALGSEGRVTVLGRRLRDDKMEGIAPERVAALRPLADLVLVEADGARGRSLKMPAAHEPVIPPCASLVVVVAALDVLGQPLDGERVHRVEIVAAEVGGGTVDEDAVVRALTAPSSYPSRLPPAARTAVFLNKAEDHPAPPTLVRRLGTVYDRVVAGSARSGEA